MTSAGLRAVTASWALCVWALSPCLAWAAEPDGRSVAELAPVPGNDLRTPRRAMKLFINSGRDGDYAQASAALDLRGLSESERAQAHQLARRLKQVLDQKLWIEWETISDAPEGNPEDGPARDVVGTIALGEERVPVALGQVADGWRISAATVARTGALYEAYGAGWLAEQVPDVFRIRLFEMEAWQGIGLLLALLLAWFLGIGLAWVGLGIADRLSRRTRATWDEQLVSCARGPARFFLGLVVLGLLVEPLHLAAPVQEVVDRCRSTLLVVSLAWLGMRLVGFFAETIERLMTSGAKDEARVRGVRTMVVVFRRVAAVLVIVTAASLVLTQFEVVKNLGMSLLASAGIAGIVIGLAAQKSISSLLAGIQLSITQPIRIGDTVIVEGEWGWIEEIHLTYVVVKVWDLRRLVVPIGRFLDHPFQNWTKVSPDIMGTVEVYADYTVPVDAVREELKRICEGNALHDGKVCGLQVTGATERTLLLRALVSSEDSGKNWDLRCEVRERLVAFLQRLEGGRYLPRTRVDGPPEAVERVAASAAAATAGR